MNLIVDDWEQLTSKMNVVDLPSRKPVNWIIDEYTEWERNNRHIGSAAVEQLEDIMGGLKAVFKVGIGKILLFKQDRPQYSEVRFILYRFSILTGQLIHLWDPTHEKYNKDLGYTGPGDVYGIEHLVRMISTLGGWMAQTNMAADDIRLTLRELTVFQRWIVRNRNIERLMNGWTAPTEKYDPSKE